MPCYTISIMKKVKKVRVRLGKRGYNIFIGNNIIKNICQMLPKDILKNPILIVTNKTVLKACGRSVMRGLKRSAGRIIVKTVYDSERAKSFETYSSILSSLIEIGKKTKPTLIALGGGVIGDVTGFAAATYKRGIPYIQIPTTLLAQVDSSIGGKVAIDMPQAKNLIGSFYQPFCVISDISFLRTLPKSEMSNGLAEVIKYGIIFDSTFFHYLDKHMSSIYKRNSRRLQFIISRCAAIKAHVVGQDEYDNKGIRVILNFGHTFAHAIEASFRYSKGHTHGESVAVGMVMACELAEKLGVIRHAVTEKVKGVIDSACLPTYISRVGSKHIMKALSYDKKFLSGKNRFVIPKRIGRVVTVTGVPDGYVKYAIEKCVM